jgi:hypothetical protein
MGFPSIVDDPFGVDLATSSPGLAKGNEKERMYNF